MGGLNAGAPAQGAGAYPRFGAVQRPGPPSREAYRVMTTLIWDGFWGAEPVLAWPFWSQIVT